MRLKRRANFESSRHPREIPKSNRVPALAACLGDGQFVAADVKGRAIPTVRRLHFDQAILAVRAEAMDIVSCPISIFIQNPSNLAGECVVTRHFQLQPFILEYACFASPPQSTVTRVTAPATSNLRAMAIICPSSAGGRVFCCAGGGPTHFNDGSSSCGVVTSSARTDQAGFAEIQRMTPSTRDIWKLNAGL